MAGPRGSKEGGRDGVVMSASISVTLTSHRGAESARAKELFNDLIHAIGMSLLPRC